MPASSEGNGELDVSGFVEKGVVVPTQSAQSGKELADLRIKDVEWRIRMRPWIGWTFIGLLLVQNAALISGIAAAALTHGLERSAPVIIGVSAATLGETAAIVQIVVSWLFNEINYEP